MYKIIDLPASATSHIHFVGIYGRCAAPVYWVYVNINNPAGIMKDDVGTKMRPAIVCYILDTYSEKIGCLES